MKPKSDNLFHFTNTLAVLKLILNKGIEPRFCLEDIYWLDVFNDSHMAFPMSCFCDIPLSRLSEHTDFYGNYGIGLTKDWGLKNKLNPVVYTPTNGTVQNVTKYMLNQYFTEKDSNKKKENTQKAYDLLTLVKPIKGKMYNGGQLIEKEFYQENEWRFVPPGQQTISKNDFEKEKDKSNKKMLKYTLKFLPNDIRYIFVKSDNDIPELVDFINTQLANFPLNDIKILQSRIVSLDTLNRDI